MPGDTVILRATEYAWWFVKLRKTSECTATRFEWFDFLNQLSTRNKVRALVTYLNIVNN